MSTPESEPAESEPAPPERPGDWPRTRWTWVEEAGAADPACRGRALERLAQAYRQPIIRAILRQGCSASEAEDLCHDFLAGDVLPENSDGNSLFGQADRERGRLRDLIFVSLKRFLISRHRYRTASRRGGGVPDLSLDFKGAPEPANGDSPDRDLIGFDRDWALSLFQRTYATLSEEFVSEGNASLYEAIQPYLLGGESLPRQKDLAEKLGMTHAALRAALSRARDRFRRHLRGAISRTVTSPNEIEEELRHLCRVLGGM